MPQKATPTALKLLAGNPGKRPFTPNEPMPPGHPPVCPVWLRGPALEEWNRIVPILSKLGVLTSVDNSVLVGYVTTYGEVVDTYKAYRPLKPALLGQMRAFAVELGLTPAARAKLSIPLPKHEDPFDKFFLQ